VRSAPATAAMLVFVTTDGGASWEVLGGNLPSIQVADLQFSARDNLIVIGTYGWGMCAFDAEYVQLPR